MIQDLFDMTMIPIGTISAMCVIFSASISARPSDSASISTPEVRDSFRLMLLKLNRHKSNFHAYYTERHWLNLVAKQTVLHLIDIR